ncbi:MAG TPA: rRNA maturation RNase YbeY [Woeseiaceae bacterium]|nr:rRNA maturation RNase YbeY [Woeseiaceae bacterium]
MSLALVRQVALYGGDGRSGEGVAALPGRHALRRWAETALRRAGLEAGERELTVRIVGEAESRELNARWRGRDRPTNVLAFPGGEPGLPGEEEDYPLGDLVVCAPVVAREAAEQGKAAESHWCHMIVHGTLHLAGHDHETPEEAARMEGLEREILAELGHPDPYRED